MSSTNEMMSIGTDTKPPVLFRGEYNVWKGRFMDFLEHNEICGDKMIECIHKGNKKFTRIVEADPTNNPPILRHEREKTNDELTAEEKEIKKAERLAKYYLKQGLSSEIYLKIDSLGTAKEIWDEIKRQLQGTAQGEYIKRTQLVNSYHEFKARENELLSETYGRFCKLQNEMRSNQIVRTDLDLNCVFLNSLGTEWKGYGRLYKQINKYLTSVTFHNIFEDLNQYQDEILQSTPKQPAADPLALVVAERTPRESTSRPMKLKQVVISDSDQDDDEDDSIEAAFQALTTASKNFKSRFSKTNNRQRFTSGSRRSERAAPVDKPRYQRDERKEEKKVESKCYNCGRSGHMIRNCPMKKVKDAEYYRQKYRLSKQKQAGNVLLVEEDQFLDDTGSDSDLDGEDHAQFCLMAHNSEGGREDDDGDELSESDEESLENGKVSSSSNVNMSHKHEHIQIILNRIKELECQALDLTKRNQVLEDS